MVHEKLSSYEQKVLKMVSDGRYGKTWVRPRVTTVQNLKRKGLIVKSGDHMHLTPEGEKTRLYYNL